MCRNVLVFSYQYDVLTYRENVYILVLTTSYSIFFNYNSAIIVENIEYKVVSTKI